MGGGGALWVTVNQAAPCVAGDVALLHLPLALADAQKGVGAVGMTRKALYELLAADDEGFTVVLAGVNLHAQVQALCALFVIGVVALELVELL